MTGGSPISGNLQKIAMLPHNYLVGGEWLPWILFSHSYWVAVIIPIDELIFFRGVFPLAHQPVNCKSSICLWDSNGTRSISGKSSILGALPASNTVSTPGWVHTDPGARRETGWTLSRRAQRRGWDGLGKPQRMGQRHMNEATWSNCVLNVDPIFEIYSFFLCGNHPDMMFYVMICSPGRQKSYRIFCLRNVILLHCNLFTGGSLGGTR